LLFPGSSVSDLALSTSSALHSLDESVPPVDLASAQPWYGGPLTWRIADTIIRNMVVRDSNFNANLDWPETDGS